MRHLLAFLFLVASAEAFHIYFHNNCTTGITVTKELKAGSATPPTVSTFQIAANTELKSEVINPKDDITYARDGVKASFIPGPLLAPLLQLTTTYHMEEDDDFPGEPKPQMTTLLKPRCLLSLCATLQCTTRVFGGTICSKPGSSGDLVSSTVLATTDFDLTYCATV